MGMEFLKANFLNTTTQLTFSPNTQTAIASNLFNRDPFYQFYTDGMNNDATIASITVAFDTTLNVSRIALLGINLKSFAIYYNGVTANTFALSQSPTTTSNWTTNSATSLYLRCTTIACSSVTIDMRTTQTVNAEKILGMLFLGDTIYETSRIPSAKDYKPKYKSKQVVHRLSDGGTRIHHVKNKWELNIKYDFISETEKNSLYDIWGMLSPVNFVPFPPQTTTASWDAIMFESVWEGDFDFYEYTDNASVAGFSGMIRLRETAN